MVSGRTRSWDLRRMGSDATIPAVTDRPSPSPDATPTLRAAVRDAVDRAWDRAIADGALPARPVAAEAPRVEVERPADPTHGDLSTNLAMKLARPYRRAPFEIAGAL